MNLQQIFKKVTQKLKTPEQIQKDMTEEALAQDMGISKEYKEIQDPKWIAQINFENFKAVFKRDIKVSRSGINGYADKMRISRMRESNSDGDIIKSMDSVIIEDNAHNQKYADMINRAYGIKAVTENGYIHMEYDVVTIERDRAAKEKAKRK